MSDNIVKSGNKTANINAINCSLYAVLTVTDP